MIVRKLFNLTRSKARFALSAETWAVLVVLSLLLLGGESAVVSVLLKKDRML